MMEQVQPLLSAHGNTLPQSASSITAKNRPQTPNASTKTAPPPAFARGKAPQRKAKGSRSGEKYTWKSFAIYVALWCAAALAIVLLNVFGALDFLNPIKNGVGFCFGVCGVVGIAIRWKWAKQGYRAN
jgi:hypothetical protein